MFFFLPLYDDNPTGRTPIVTYALIGLCTIIFPWQLGQNADAVAYSYGMIPARVFGSARLPSALSAIATGDVPTAISAETVPVARLTTATLFVADCTT